LLSFLEHLQERFTKIPVVRSRGGGFVEEIRGHVNPSVAEIRNFLGNSKYSTLRFVYDPRNRNLHVWDGGSAVHAEVVDAFPEKERTKEFVLGYIELDAGVVSMSAYSTSSSKVDTERMISRIPVLANFANEYDAELTDDF